MKDVVAAIIAVMAADVEMAYLAVETTAVASG